MFRKILNTIYFYLVRFVIAIFSYGNVPKSVAFIMDGNRRYAESKNKKKIIGHEDGLSKLLEVLEWCLYLGIREVTTFALSIDNFNRSAEELNGLMGLVKEKFYKLSEKEEYFEKYGVKVLISGNLNFVDNEIKELLQNIQNKTNKNSK